MTIATAVTVVSIVTQPTPVLKRYEADFRHLRPGSYVVCVTLPDTVTLPDNGWTTHHAAAVDGAYGKPWTPPTIYSPKLLCAG
jgi:hypothetical protein